jgi:N-acetylmuramoyl-L-alanine amidase
MCYAEAKGEGLAGQMMVASVILNRILTPGFPKTLQTVLYKRSGKNAEFSPMNNGSFARAPIDPTIIDGIIKLIAT